MFTMTMHTDGAAFRDNEGGESDTYRRAEVRRIMFKTAELIANGRESGTVLDINGNTCGMWSL